MSQQGGSARQQPASVGVPTLRTATFDDYSQISELESRNSPKRVLSEAEWRGLFVDNPLWPRVGATWPIGWVLQGADGTVVGSILNIPSLYRWRGKELICSNGRGWVVDPKYRGYALLLMEEYYSQDVDLFVNNTVADWVTSAQLEYAIKVPVGDWAVTSFRPILYRAFAAEGLAVRGFPLRSVLAPIASGALWLKDTLSVRIPASPEPIDVVELDHFDKRFDTLWTEIASANFDKLLAERSSRTLNWHYSIPAARGDLRLFAASRANSLRAYCVLLRHHGQRGFETMRLIDFQSAEPRVDLLSPLLRAVIRKCTAEKVHALSSRVGPGIPKMQSFDRIAPYRYRRNWRFFYQTSNPELASDLGQSAFWDPSEYDGDASYA